MASDILAPFLACEDVDDKSQVDPLNVLTWISQDVHLLLNEGLLPAPLACALEAELAELTRAFHTCMKLKATPVPMPFRQLLGLGLLIFALLIPIPFVNDWGWYLGLPATAAAMFLFGMGFLGVRLHDAFGINAAKIGEPLIDLAAMVFATQNDCWAITKLCKAHDSAARKKSLLSVNI